MTNIKEEEAKFWLELQDYVDSKIVPAVPDARITALEAENAQMKEALTEFADKSRYDKTVTSRAEAWLCVFEKETEQRDGA